VVPRAVRGAVVVNASTTAGRPRLIVFGNEKGGSGKSTAAVHVAVGLTRAGKRVAALDLDARQGSLSRYLANRDARLPTPPTLPIPRSTLPVVADADADERNRLDAAIAECAGHEFIVIDTPGSDSNLTRLAHARADVLVTPINDSFVDLDLLARVDPDTHQVVAPSLYSEMVWEQRKRRALTDGQTIDWIVMRNRMGHVEGRNKRVIADILAALAKRIGFRLAPGFGERVIFRELFLKGLTLLDLGSETGHAMTLSHVAARQEVRALLDAILAAPPPRAVLVRSPTAMAQPRP
jgi:chromosome partitioning protein